MTFPSVLLIGAMKAGTTSLYFDLAEHPDVFLCGDKEPHALCSDHVLSEQGRREYAKVYAAAKDRQILIDASTGYAKRPDFEGIAQRALATLPAGFQVIYLVRHPVERIISHYHHEMSIGQVGSSIDEAVRKCPRFVNYSRYAYQLEPWLDAVGLDRIRVVRFEDYADRRLEVIAQLQGFLGLPPTCSSIDVDKVYNKSQGKPIRNRFWSAIYGNPYYRRLVRPLLPVKLRLKIRDRLLPKAPERNLRLHPETDNWLRNELTEDVVRLSRLINQSSPLWSDFAAPAPYRRETPR